MTFKWSHIALIIGMLLVIGSFVFFGLNSNTYSTLLLAGIIISVIAFCIVIFRKDSTRSKLRWSFIVIVGIVIQQLSEPGLIRLSYIILVKQNERIFSKINALLLSKSSDATWVADTSLWKRNNISQEEGSQIQNLLANILVISVNKNSSRIYYMTFSRIDIAHGISYYHSNEKPNNERHLIGNWYY